jgi:hypothetical protein
MSSAYNKKPNCRERDREKSARAELVKLQRHAIDAELQVLMSASTVVVAINAQLLKRVKL